MKRITLVLTLILAFSVMYAQNNKRVAAYNYMNSYEFDKAKTAIDACITHPKTMNSYKTWWYYGKIYQNLSINKKYQHLEENAAQKALDGYAKALEKGAPTDKCIPGKKETEDKIKAILKTQSTDYDQQSENKDQSTYPKQQPMNKNKSTDFKQQSQPKEQTENYEQAK